MHPLFTSTSTLGSLPPAPGASGKLPNVDVEVNKGCTAEEYANDYKQEELFAQAGGFHDCRLSDLVEFFHEHATFCVLPPDSPGLPGGLRMRLRALPSLSEATAEAPGASGMCDYDYSTMTAGASRALGDEAADQKAAKELRGRAFKKCREKVEKLMVLAKYQRFQSCIEDLDSKR